VHDGLVIVAPTDSGAIFAFEADSGHLVWKTDPISEEVKLSHLLGVAKGRLVATGDRVLLFDVRNGRLVSTWPDSGKSPEGYGRGLLAGNRIYWPTRNEIQVLDQRSGLLAERPIRLMEVYRTTGGNLVAGDGYLIVAQSDALVVFCQNSRLIERYRDEIAKSPEQAATYYRLARAAEAVGRDQLALQSYELVTQKALPTETIDGTSLADAARDHEFRLLTRVAGAARKARQFDQALVKLETAAKISRSDTDRLQAHLLLAEVQLEATRPAKAVEILEHVLTDERLRGLTVSSDDHHRSIRADLLIADRLAGIVREHHRRIYEQYDRRARELFERGRREQDSRLLDEVSRIFPVAEIVPDALLALGEAHQGAGRLAPAAAAYKRLLSLSSPPDEARVRALWQLAAVFESQNLLVSARDALLQIITRYPRIRLDDLGRDGPVADLASLKLAHGPLSQVAADRPRPSVPLPLARVWHAQAGTGRSLKVLTATGVPPGLQSSRAFAVEGTSLGPIDPASGECRWKTEMGAPVIWVGYLADKLLAATAQQIIALDLNTGAGLWRTGQGPPAGKRPGPDPFARPVAATASPSPARGTLHEFQLLGSRLFCLRGEDELIALDGDSGSVNWTFTARGSSINSKIWIGADRAVLEIQKPSHIVVLETESGRMLWRTALAEGESLERVPVPIDEDHVLLVTDRRTVKKFDTSRGQFVWDYRESMDMPVHGPPRVMVDAERVLVLHDGRVLIRIDPVNGSKRWSTVLGIEDLSERPEAIVSDDRRVYCVSRDTLRAFSLTDGGALWNCHLTGPENSQWSIALSERCVMAYPRTSSLAEDELESLPVVVRRQDSGALVQRLVFPASIADVSLRLDSKGALVATPRILWSLAERPVGSVRNAAQLP
jgi:outer membrane protein assembly factor BamB/tetratricopeptide (TPR) repeat protein